VFLSSTSLQELLIPTKAELVTPTVTIGIAAKPLHKKNQGKKKKKTPPKQKQKQKNKLKDKNRSKIKSNNWKNLLHYDQESIL
jgi:hypothetical protein